MPNQYCRYCSNAEDYNGDGTDFVCFADAPCGDGGKGIFYSAAKAKAVNHCKHYAFCGIDIFTAREYQPCVPREKLPDDDYGYTEQITFKGQNSPAAVPKRNFHCKKVKNLNISHNKQAFYPQKGRLIP